MAQGKRFDIQAVNSDCGAGICSKVQHTVVAVDYRGHRGLDPRSHHHAEPYLVTQTAINRFVTRERVAPSLN